MFVVEVLIGVAILLGIAFVASRDTAGLDDADTDRPDIGLPETRLLAADDIDRLRFRVVAGVRGAVRGYRFDDVDATMRKVEEALRAHEAAQAARERTQST